MDNKALVQRLYDEAFTSGNLDVIDMLIAADAVDHEQFPGATGDARADLRAFLEMLRAGLPDLRVDVEDMIEEGDRVAARITMHGTHRGELLGFAPTGATVSLPVIDIMRCDGGQLVEHWGASDSALLMEQLGAPAT